MTDPHTILECDFADMSEVNGHTFTVVGTPTFDTSIFSFGAIVLDGATHLAFDPIPALAFGTADFTIEAWTYYTFPPSDERGFLQLNTSAGFHHNYDPGFMAGVATAQQWYSCYDGGTVAQAGSAAPSTPCHYALWRLAGVTRFAANGTIAATHPDTFDYQSTYLMVGGYYGNAFRWKGQLCDLRISNIARYGTSNFTPPALVDPAPPVVPPANVLTVTGPDGHAVTAIGPTGHAVTVTGPTGRPLTATGPGGPS